MMLRKIYLLVIGLVICGFTAFAQNNSGAVKVLLKDKGNNEVIPFANVVVYQNGVQVGVGTTNMDGEAIIKPLAPGKYDVKGVYVGYQPLETKGVLVGEGKTAYVTLALSNGEGVKLDEVEVVTYQVPLVDPDTKSGQTVTREDYQNMATKNINSVAATTAGVFAADEGAGLQIRGGRETGTTYFVDGIKIIGRSPNGLPQQSIEQINVITGGLPAMYGDANAGVITITTRGPQSKFFGSVELISSQLTDHYGYNSIGFSLGGPIIQKRDTNGNKTPIVGFMLSGQGNYEKDPSPSAVQLYTLNDEKLKEIQETPLIPSKSGSGYNRALEYVTKDDLKKIKSHQNIAQKSISLNGKIDIKAAANTNVSIGGALDFNTKHDAARANELFNYENNAQVNATVWRAYARVTQKFGNTQTQTEKEKSQSAVQNAFFSFLASVETNSRKAFDDTHKDKIFNYGYVGKFNRSYRGTEDIFNYELQNDFTVNGQLIGPAYEYFGRSEYRVTFEPSTLNPNYSNYTTYLFNQAGGSLFRLSQVNANGGLLNGDYPQGIYNMWSATGAQSNSYFKVNQLQFRFASSFNVDIKNHALSLGVEYDQRDERVHQIISPVGLWNRMRALVNKHTSELDKSNPYLVPELSGTYPAYAYNYKYNASEQTEFSIKLLEKLGLPKDNTTPINIDELDPSTFSLDMFSAIDLLGQNSGNQLVSYYGYDHLGNRTTEATNLNDYLNKKDANGYNLFPIGSFRPIYMAGYVQDKFDFKDLKFNVGLRVDRYDANQKVLKDKYSIFQIKTIGDTRDESDQFHNVVHPGNLGEDYAIYTTEIGGGTILGYRNGDQWYDTKGNEVSDPTILQGSAGKLTPYLKDYKSGDHFSIDAFTNYKAKVYAMPRLAFSFPISDVANFFAHYDVLTSRPRVNHRFDPSDYYYLQSESSLPFLTNPNLLPERTVDYELGFTQVLSERKNASLTITSYYREFRNMLTIKQITGGYPKSYLTYVNQDFGTSKGFSLVYDLRRTGGSRINANYTLGFADGTGSNANSGVNVAGSGQPNLRILLPLDYDQRHTFSINYDYRFGSGKDYKGPEIKRKEGNSLQVLKDLGANLQFVVGSGTPYTRWANAVASNGGLRTTILGSVNGSYKPWTFRANLRIDKNIELTWGKKDADKKKQANLNVYLQVLNLFNNKNVLGVYNFTGNPDDDGYLASAQGIATLPTSNSPASFVDQYNIFINKPDNYSRPRVIRIGLALDF